METWSRTTVPDEVQRRGQYGPVVMASLPSVQSRLFHLKCVQRTSASRKMTKHGFPLRHSRKPRM